MLEGVATLQGELDLLTNEIAGDTASEAQVAGAKDAVSSFSTTFDQVAEQTVQQAERIATLQKSTNDLEALATNISDAVLTEEKRISAEAFAANSQLDDANQLQRTVFELKDEVVKVHMLYLKGSGNIDGEDLTSAIDTARNLVSSTKQMKYKQIDGIDRKTVSKLASQANKLNAALENLTKDLGFSEAYEARQAVGNAIDGMNGFTEEILGKSTRSFPRQKPTH